VFIVGSPRSGTSILAWCLGQHPNLLPLEESNWLGKFAVDLGSTYALGVEHGRRSQLSAVGIDREQFYRSFGAMIDGLLLGTRAQLEQLSRAADEPRWPELQISRSPDEPKKRCVDATPEYSFYVCGLLKLFPDARFIHILRSVDAVAHSLLHFGRLGNRGYSPAESFDYWYRTVSACLLAEKALGGTTMLRVEYEQLCADPKRVLRDCLSFLDEPFCEVCLEPMQLRINSSHAAATAPAEPTTCDDEIAVRAAALWTQLKDQRFAKRPPDNAARQELESAFRERCVFVGDLDADRLRAIAALDGMQQEMEMHARSVLTLSVELEQARRRIEELEQVIAEQSPTPADCVSEDSLPDDAAPELSVATHLF